MNAKAAMMTLVAGLTIGTIHHARAQYTRGTELIEDPGIAPPQAVRIVEPRIPIEMIGQRVEMKFEIQENGRPSGVRTRESFPEAWRLAERLARVIPRWRFEPARGPDGIPVKVTVVLPVRVVAYDTHPAFVAGLRVVER